MSTRFDYIRYDDKSTELQSQYKETFQAIEGAFYEKKPLNDLFTKVRQIGTAAGLPTSRAIELFLKKLGIAESMSVTLGGEGDFLNALEEAYMWTGKAIRDWQISRGGGALEQPERTAS